MQLRPVDARHRHADDARSTITKVSQSAGMIIQHYDFRRRAGAGPVYRGDTYFGFFRREALANQVGIREATPYRPGADERGPRRSLRLSRRRRRSRTRRCG